MPHDDAVILYKELSQYDYNIKKYIQKKMKYKANLSHIHYNFTGATEDFDGSSGFVPFPEAGLNNRYLCSDGTWREVDVADAKVNQNNTANNANYRLMLSLNADDKTSNGELRKSANFTANPSTGEFYAYGYKRIDITGKTLNINTLNLATGSPMIQRYIQKTNTGATSILNIPVSNCPFILDVELVRWSSQTDYITKQKFTTSDSSAVYERWCNSNIWTSWKRVLYADGSNLFTDVKFKIDVLSGGNVPTTEGYMWMCSDCTATCTGSAKA